MTGSKKRASAESASSATSSTTQAPTPTPIPPESPPELPEQIDLSRGLGPDVLRYFALLMPATKFMVEQQFKQSPSSDATTGGIGLTGPLNEQPPLAIVTGTREQMNSFKHPWDMKECKSALQSTQLYEASGNVFWFDNLFKPTWEAKEIPGTTPTWDQILRCRTQWSPDTFKLSADEDLSSRAAPIS